MPSPAPPHPGNRLPGLEALRFFAALCILLLHTRAVFGGQRVFGHGYLAVEFFLMLSGFLMAFAQEARITEPAVFMAQRYKRLWPTMALGSVIGLPRLWLLSQSALTFAGTAAANLALLPVWGATFAFPLNIPAWTIFYELVANSLHAFVLRHVRTWGIWLGIAALVPVMAWLGMHWGNFDLGAKPETLLPGLPRIMLAYLIGMALGRWWGASPPIPVPALLAIPAMPAILAAAWYWKLDTSWHFDMVFTLLACPLMIAGGLRLKRFHRFAGLLGQLSFPLFAVQMPILQGMERLGFGYWTGGLTALAGGILAALLARLPGQIRRWRKQERPA